MDGIDERTETLGSDVARFTMEDGRVIEFRVVRVEYPYVWGDRYLGENMPLRSMRVDLRDVSRIELKRS